MAVDWLDRRARLEAAQNNELTVDATIQRFANDDYHDDDLDCDQRRDDMADIACWHIREIEERAEAFDSITCLGYRVFHELGVWWCRDGRGNLVCPSRSTALEAAEAAAEGTRKGFREP